MGIDNKRSWLIVLLAVSSFCTSLNAEVIFQENFERNIVDVDGNVSTVEKIPFWPRRESNIDPSVFWYTTYSNLAFRKTSATAGDGQLTILTEDVNSGILSRASSDYNFFNRETTFTFDGIKIEALGQSRINSQWAAFGVVANSDRTLWKSYSLLLVRVSGAGAFSLQVWQPGDKAPRKEFRSTVFPFNVEKLRKVELTMDAVTFRAAFTFENPLDIMAFGGPHNLEQSLWFIDKVGVNYAKSRVADSLRTLNAYIDILAEANISATQSEINTAQANVDLWQTRYDDEVENYNAKILEAEVIQGDSALMVSVSSDVSGIVNSMSPTEKAIFDVDYASGLAQIGARVTVNSITVETSDILPK